jgi:hypothetical protein
MGVSAVSRRRQLTRFLEDGRIDLDSKPVENRIRPVTEPGGSPNPNKWGILPAGTLIIAGR